MSDEVIRMLSCDWLMRGSSQGRGCGLCLFPGTMTAEIFESVKAHLE